MGYARKLLGPTTKVLRLIGVSALLGCMAVDQHYVDKLVDWVTSETAKLGGGC